MNLQPLNEQTRLAIIGLGYVGLPLAHAFGKIYSTIGFDINKQRISEIKKGVDRNNELAEGEFSEPTKTHYSDDEESLAGCDIYIITAPTPIDDQNQPDLEPVRQATRLVASHLKKGGTVIFESTVYPGATEEECVPLLSELSGLTYNSDFFVGYSPERISPGDRTRPLSKIVKITSGSTPEAAAKIDQLYKSIIEAGTHLTSSIRVAEAAKVIENTQRDVNIALVNELAILFEKLDIDTQEVLKAAGSKWNFLPFSPGLVGGHCIGVDPYYLTYKAQQVGYHPEVILAGRRINDSMGAYVAERVIKLMLSKRIHIIDSKILILGRTFKENCPDTRNSRVVDIIETLQSYHSNIEVFDPWVEEDSSELLIKEPRENYYDAVIIAVAHDHFSQMGLTEIRKFTKESSVVFDVKHLFDSKAVDGSL
ncbi:MAG: UDP-N-acetyl-d-glucosamine 6-dehydrogenase WbpA [Pseudohongiella sp.]|nr:MAG: UDP-N-acetyl-d-glucosamine 6-dehydrogenase WbpA [Pseudohongiella sp.]